MSDWDENKAQVLARLRRAEGQVRGVIALIEKEDDCDKVAQQLSAARKALDRAFFDLMACVTRRELADLGFAGHAADKRLSHITGLLTRYG